MIEFIDCTKCTDCPLHKIAKHPGIPTREFAPARGKDKALLFVGIAPGYNEDRTGKSWIGWAGGLLQKFIDSMHYVDYADIYLGNACRCVLPPNTSPQKSEISTCRKYLAEDVRRLASHYKEVIIFALGAPAALSVTKITTLTEAFKYQGVRPLGLLELMPADSELPPMRTFISHHPAILHPTRKPALATAVEAHFVLVLRYLCGQFFPNQIEAVPLVGEPLPEKLPPKVALDIETYGILAGKSQTVFHPVKSKEIDGIDYPEQIVTVSLGYLDQGVPKTHLFVYQWEQHRRIIEDTMVRIQRQKVILLGQNIKFDLLYLWYCNKYLRYLLTPQSIQLDDTLILSFLLYEQRPEKGLKELATLFGVSDYSKLKVSGREGNAKSCTDPELHRYNCLDVATTLVLDKELWERIRTKYGAQSPKLGEACAKLRNDIIWDTWDLERNGVTFDVAKLQALHKEYKAKCEQIVAQLKESNIIVAGKGSDTSLREFVMRAATEANLTTDPRLRYTEKEKKIAIDIENRNLIIANLCPGATKDTLSVINDHETTSKLLNSYLKPLLHDKRKGIVFVKDGVGYTYPSWYPFPAYQSRGGEQEKKGGGTIQGRFSAQKPAVQTLPPPIMNCLTSRFPGGSVVGYDLNQIELRIPALLSGDPLLLDAYQNDKDLHTQTAMKLFPSANPAVEGWKDSEERQLAKRLNFLMVNRGGPTRFQEVARAEMGLELDLGFCQDTIDQWYRTYHVFKQWQDGLLLTARRLGYIELPTGWSRSYGEGTSADVYMSEICNQSVQTPAAQLLQSSHGAALPQVDELRSRIILQIHDSLVCDIPPGEMSAVDGIMSEILPRPPVLRVFEDYAGRSIPIKYGKKVYLDGGSGDDHS